MVLFLYLLIVASCDLWHSPPLFPAGLPLQHWCGLSLPLPWLQDLTSGMLPCQGHLAMKFAVSNPRGSLEQLVLCVVHGGGEDHLTSPPSLTPADGLLSLWQNCAMVTVLDVNHMHVSSWPADD